MGGLVHRVSLGSHLISALVNFRECALSALSLSLGYLQHFLRPLGVVLFVRSRLRSSQSPKSQPTPSHAVNVMQKTSRNVDAPPRSSFVERTVVEMIAAKKRTVRRFGLASVFLLCLAAGALGGIGAWSFYARRRFLRNDLNSLEEHLPRTAREDLTYSIDPTYIAMATGGFGLVVGFAGFVAVFRRNATRVAFAFVLAALLLLLLAHIATGIIALVYRQTIRHDIRQSLLIDFRNRITQHSTSMDVVQRDYECCGAENPDDWEANVNFTCRDDGSGYCGVPRSCCRQESIDCGYRARVAHSDAFYDVGCVDSVRMNSWQRIETIDLFVLSVGAFALSFIVVLALVFAAVYLHKIESI